MGGRQRHLDKRADCRRPGQQFKGDVAKSSWLLNEDIAIIYRAYSTLDWKRKITSPGREAAKSEVFDAGSAVTIKVDDSRFAEWKKLELYDGRQRWVSWRKGRPSSLSRI